MSEMKTLTMGGKTYDSFVDATARGETAKAVNYTLQTLTEEQRAQARENIGTVSEVDTFDVFPTSNRLDMSALTGKAAMPADGRLLTSSSYANYSVSDYIPVTPGEVITYQRTNSENYRQIYTIRWLAAFDENKKVIASAGTNTAISQYTVPTGVYYIRVTLPIKENSTVTNHAIVASETLIPYEEYGEYLILKPERHNDLHIQSVCGVLPKTIALPKTIYAFVNQPIVVYLQNIMGYRLDDVHVAIKNGKGKLYKDRWVYTPSAADRFDPIIHIEDQEYRQLNDDSFSVVVKDTTEKTSLKVLVIGDSTVNAGTETQKMLDLAALDGYNLTLLGTRGVAPNLHEGRGGWKATSYVNNAQNSDGTIQNPFYNPDTATFDFSYYMTQQGYAGVDCVFLQLGINDVFSALTDAVLKTAINTYLSNMQTIVDSIHSYNADIKIVMNLIIPCEADQDEFTENYGMEQTVWRCKKNTYTANIALLDKFSGVSNVYLSHYNAAIDTATNMRGDVHPVADGYNQLGTQMYAFARAIN